MRGYRSIALLHISDFFPTLLRVARAHTPPCVSALLFGVDAWDAIRLGARAHSHSARCELLHNIDPISGAEVSYA